MVEILKTEIGSLDREDRKQETFRVQSESARIAVTDFGGYITNWETKNEAGEWVENLYQGSELKRTGIPTLFPYYGDTDKYGDSHGLGRNSFYEITKVERNKISMRLKSESTFIPSEAKQNYPFPFETTLTTEALDDGSLLCTMEVENTGDGDLPIAPGLHPYFPEDINDKKSLQIEGVEGFNPYIDWETHPPDDEYPYSGKAIMKFSKKDITIEDVTDGGPVTTHFVVWSQGVNKKDKNFVCGEPVTRENRGIDTDPILIRPNGKWSMSIKFSTAVPQAA